MKNITRALVLIFWLITAPSALAITVDCVIDAATEAGIPANVLLAIASAEGGKDGQFVKNTNGTSDIGAFQINTVHWEHGGQFRNVIPISAVANNGCYSARVAAYIVKKNLLKFQKNEYWTVVSYYNSRNPQKNAIYRRKVIKYANQWGQWLLKNYHHRIVYN